MKVYYNVTLEMLGTDETEENLLESASRILGFSKSDIEETDTRSATVFFASTVSPTEMRDRARRLMVAFEDFLLVDVMYRFEYAMVPDRFVVRHDGTVGEYTGFIVFREDD